MLTDEDMETSQNQWKKSTFVSAAHVLHKSRNSRRHGKRRSNILRAENVELKKEPVEIGTALENIQITPIMENGQVKALRVTCACGRESTFDIQYAAGGKSV